MTTPCKDCHCGTDYRLPSHTYDADEYSAVCDYPYHSLFARVAVNVGHWLYGGRPSRTFTARELERAQVHATLARAGCTATGT